VFAPQMLAELNMRIATAKTWFLMQRVQRRFGIRLSRSYAHKKYIIAADLDTERRA
jgi:hypothetical protein